MDQILTSVRDTLRDALTDQPFKFIDTVGSMELDFRIMGFHFPMLAILDGGYEEERGPWAGVITRDYRVILRLFNRSVNANRARYDELRGVYAMAESVRRTLTRDKRLGGLVHGLRPNLVIRPMEYTYQEKAGNTLYAPMLEMVVTYYEEIAWESDEESDWDD